MRRGLAFSALLACASSAAAAADKTDFAAEFKRITGAGQTALIRSAGAREAQQKTTAELDALVKKAEAADASKMTPEDLSAVAQAQLRLRRNDLALKWAEMAVKADAKIPSGHETKVRALVALKKVDDAEKALASAAPLTPPSKASLQMTLYSAHLAAKNNDGAIRNLKPYLDYVRNMVRTNHSYRGSLTYYTSQLADLQQKAGKPDDALKTFNDGIALARLVAQEKPAVWVAATELQLALAAYHKEHGRAAEAERIVKEETAAVEKAFADARGEARGAQLERKVRVMQVAAADADETASAKLRTDLLALLTDEATKHRKEPAVVNAALNAFATAVSGWTSSSPKAANAGMAKLNELISTLGDDLPAATRRGIEQRMATTSQSIATSLARDNLIGKPMAELKADAWLNGSPLTAADLKGKVVLLDFWAVWCGPCIATFPHLRQWNEHFAKDGLVIIGATQYYKYGWDEAEKRAKRGDGDLSHEDERKETVKFLAHHQLKHPIAFFANSDISKAFKVSGIPQAVVVDRQGNVRLIRVGATEPNAKAIEKMIKQCLAEPATASGG